MTRNNYVKDSFWTDSYIESLSPDGKLIFIYLLTNPQVNIAGVYELREKRMAFETGYDVEVVSNMLDKFQQDGKIIYQDNWIVLVNHFKHLPLGQKTAEGVNRVISKAPETIQSYFSLQTKENTNNEEYDVLVLDTPYIPHTRGSQTGVNSYKLVVNSKVNSKGEDKPTPKQEAQSFFENEERQNEVIAYLVDKGVPEQSARQEIDKFVDYWTEPNSTGKKQRWQQQKTFEVRRRLKTWLGNANKFSGRVDYQPKTVGDFSK